MILQLLIDFVFGLINMLLALIPKIELPQEFLSLLDDATYVFSLASYFLPVATIVTCLTVIFIVDNIKFLMSIFNWIVSKIPTIS